MKHEIDFEIYTRGAEETLIIVDYSEYFERPSNVILEVIFPSIEKVYSSYVNPSTVTAITTKSLGFSGLKTPFPDGLYQLKLSVKPNNSNFKCKNYLKLDRTNARIKELLQKECIDDVDVDLIYDIDKYLVSARANEDKNPKVAIELFNEALKKLKKLTCE